MSLGKRPILEIHFHFSGNGRPLCSKHAALQSMGYLDMYSDLGWNELSSVYFYPVPDI